MFQDVCITRTYAHAHLKTWVEKAATFATSGTFRCNDARKCRSSYFWVCSSFRYRCCLPWYFKENRVAVCSGFCCNICYSLLFVRALVIGTTVGWAVVFQYMSEITIGLIVSMRIGVACMRDVCVYLRRQVDSGSWNVNQNLGRCGTAQRKTNGGWWDGSRSCFEGEVASQ